MEKRTIILTAGASVVGAVMGFFGGVYYSKHKILKPVQEVSEEPEVEETEPEDPPQTYHVEPKPDLNDYVARLEKTQRDRQVEEVKEMISEGKTMRDIAEEEEIETVDIYDLPVRVDASDVSSHNEYDIVTMIYHPETNYTGRYLVNNLNGTVLNDDIIDEDLGGWDFIDEMDEEEEEAIYIRNDRQQTYYEVLKGVAEDDWE